VVILGIGPGIGIAVAKRFAADGFSVALVSRNLEKLVAFQKEIEAKYKNIEVISQAIDCGNEESIKTGFAHIREKLGHPQVLVYNTGPGFKRASVLDLTTADLRNSYNVQVIGALVAVKEVLPHMQQAGQGTIIFTGATAQTRGGSGLASFATAKFGLRAFAQSLAREVQPKGIHVSLVNIDGIVMDTISDNPKLINPDDVAETYFQLHLQHKSAWTHEIDLRPFLETW